ncbi:DUF2255 family protein [Agromyces sp. ZXT2-6]|uniref:DUF2255 family protein n=1 Tax=Agromyces sp. ZXT2-6 TaxID=3461153 RepID=UPI0040553027
MTTWGTEQLARIGDAEEIEVSSHRGDGSLRKYVIIWSARVGDELFVRSAYGPDNGWFRRAKASGSGRVRAGGVEHDVAFVDVPAAEAATHEALDAAYRAKYAAHPPRIVATVVGPDAAATTLRLEPRG